VSGSGERVLHVTSGDLVAEGIRRSGLPGDVLPWRDALNEGPVPGGLSLEELSRVRARFVADHLEARPYDRVLKEFAARDARLESFRRFREVTLWFEHDLSDQLQLIQLLHWFALRDPAGVRLSLICIGEYPGVKPFHGLAQLTPQQLAGLRETRRDLSSAQLTLGDRAWNAFSSEHPLRLQQLMREDLSALPFLRAAMLRHFEQFPSTRDGLSRSERQILQTLAAERLELGTVFRRSQIESEERPFMGDAPFLLHVGFLMQGEPLIEFEDGRGFSIEPGPPDPADLWERRLRATEPGRKVLNGQVDRLRYQPIDRWLGGLHLQGDPAWRWGHRRHAIVAQPGAPS